MAFRPERFDPESAAAGDGAGPVVALRFQVSRGRADAGGPVDFERLEQARSLAQFLNRRGEDAVISVATFCDGAMIEPAWQEVARLKAQALAAAGL